MIQALGKIVVPVPGTPVVVTSNLTSSGNPAIPEITRCHGIMVEALPGNTGNIYVGTVTMNKATGAQVFAILAIPTTNFLPTFSAANTFTPNGLDAAEFYLDADVAGEGAIVTIIYT